MKKSIPKKKPGRPATGKDPLYGVRIAEGATRSEAIRRLVEIGLKAKK
jgi:hypothetical protein